MFAYNTDRFATKEAYVERYPGEDFVDVLGFDIYQKGSVGINDVIIKDLDKSLTTLEALATEHNKILALTEFGYNEVPGSTWWTNVLWKVMQNQKISYALAGAMQVKKMIIRWSIGFHLKAKSQLLIL